MSLLTVGVLKSPEDEADKRIPIHPDHLAGLEPDLAKHLLLETGFGANFGVTDRELDPLVGGFMTREQLIDQADVLLVVDPWLRDLNRMHAGQVLWGWLNGRSVISAGASRRGLTVIDCDAMNHWATDGSFVAPVFHTNNELAGYASVLHAMTLRGLSGQFGDHLTAVVLGLGNVAKGAIRALEGIGIKDITVLTLTDGATRSTQLGGMTMEQMQRRDDDAMRTIVLEDGRAVCVAEFVGRYDVIVNCITQDPQKPLEFVDSEEIGYFPAGRLIIDVAPISAWGFGWAHWTPIGDPTFEVGNGVTYYAGNGSQAYLWNSATWEISRELLPYLRSVMRGPEGWDSDRTLSRALSVRDGQVKTQGGQG